MLLHCSDFDCLPPVELRLERYSLQAEAEARELAARVHSLEQQNSVHKNEADDAEAKLADLKEQLASHQTQAEEDDTTDAEQMRDATRRVLLAQVGPFDKPTLCGSVLVPCVSCEPLLPCLANPVHHG